VSNGIVEIIDDLFAIDAEARAQNLDLAARDQLRQQRARRLLETIRQQMEAARERALPASKLGGAITYTPGLWERLTRFLDYPELELSTNLAENSMRGVALGRKRWIHIGSPQDGPNVAAILSVVETCRRLRIPVRRYLGAVLVVWQT
jgi:transposase